MPSILIIGNYKHSSGGISTQIDILKKHLLEDGFNVKIFSCKKNYLLRPLLLLPLIFIIKRYSIIHVHGCSWVGGFWPIITGAIAAKIFRKKLIVTYHGGQAGLYFSKYKYPKYFLGLADRITVPSTFLKKSFSDIYGLMPEVIPNIYRAHKRKFKYRNSIKPIVITTRTLREVYNIPCAIRAFKIVHDRYLNAKMFILGDGPQRRNLESLCEELKLDSIEFVGRIDNDRINDYLNRADIFVNPTTEDNMPLSVLEAFEAGLPVVSTDVGGIPDIIDDGINGMLAKNNDPEKIAELCIELIETPTLAADLTKNALDQLGKYSWKKNKPKLMAIYEA